MVSISWYLPEKERDEMSKTQHLQIFEKSIFQNLFSHIHLYVYIYTHSGTRRERERTNKTQNVVSISWYLPEKVRDEMSKKQYFLMSESCFSKPALIHTFICTYIYGQWHKEGEKREQTKHKTWFP